MENYNLKLSLFYAGKYRVLKDYPTDYHKYSTYAKVNFIDTHGVWLL